MTGGVGGGEGTVLQFVHSHRQLLAAHLYLSKSLTLHLHLHHLYLLTPHALTRQGILLGWRSALRLLPLPLDSRRVQ